MYIFFKLYNLRVSYNAGCISHYLFFFVRINIFLFIYPTMRKSSSELSLSRNTRGESRGMTPFELRMAIVGGSRMDLWDVRNMKS